MCITHSHKETATFLRIALLIAGFAFPVLTCAQSFTPISHEAFSHNIEAQAQQDAKNERQRATPGDLKILFGEEASVVGLTMIEVQKIYDNAYSRAAPEKPWWESLQSKAGWVGAALFFVLFILRDLLKDYLIRFFNWLAKGAYNHLAGYRIFWSFALHKYRRALLKAANEMLEFPFRPHHPSRMNEIYIALKVKGTVSDAFTALGHHRRLMVVGDPGSGKTMLMRHITRTYAREGLHHYHDRPIPILLELRRLNDSSKDLMSHLTAELDRKHFPNAQGFIEAGLKRGSLMLLLDGLDEVAQKARGPVVAQIKDLVEGSHCRVVVTCRTAVYERQLDGWSHQHLEIIEFDDQQIQRFLRARAPEMPAGKSVEHLLHTLRERPRIMALAHNPLMLTIIAYLYSDTAFVLPHSRAQFYKECTSILLNRWDQARQNPNKYEAVQKRLVLQGLACYFQGRAGTQRRDRRSAARQDLLDEVKKVLPSCNLEDTAAEPILDEIVERSGLLIALDEGIGYQFAHLNLQEFFAALALKDERDQLAADFKAAPATWRETAKLWCGLEHDSTALIKAVATVDPTTALECLGDAQQVDADYAAELIQSFCIRLGKPAPDQEAVARALALVAAGPHPWGEAIFKDLVADLTNPATATETRLATAQVLSLTNRPQAADALVGQAVHDPAFRPLLTPMGNLVVPAVAEWAAGGKAWSLNTLYSVGTPQAALALAPLLWSADRTTQHQAAWRLGALLADSDVEAALNAFTFSQEQRRADCMDWVWTPFEPDPDSPLHVLGGRVAHLLHTAPENALPPDDLALTVDPRLDIPLCAVAAQDNKLEWPTFEERATLIKKLKKLKKVLHTSQPVPRDLETEQESILNAVNSLSGDRVWRYLFHNLALATRLELLDRLLTLDPAPTKDDWRNVLRPIPYAFDKSPQFRAFKFGLFVLVCLALWQIGATLLEAPSLVTWENGLIFLMGLALAGGWIALSRDFPEPSDMSAFSMLFSGPIIGAIAGVLSGNLAPPTVFDAAVFGAGFGAVFGVLVGVVFGIPVVILADFPRKTILFLPVLSFFGLSVSIPGGVFGAVFGALLPTVFDAFGVAVGTGIGIVVLGAIFGAFTGLLTRIFHGSAVGDTRSKDTVPPGIRFVPAVARQTCTQRLGIEVMGATVGAIAMPLVFFPTAWLCERWGAVEAGAFWAAWLVWASAFLTWSAGYERRTKNPLRGLLKMKGEPGVKLCGGGGSYFGLLKGKLSSVRKREE